MKSENESRASFDAKRLSEKFAVPEEPAGEITLEDLGKHVYGNTVSAKDRHRSRAKNKAARIARRRSK